LSRNRRKNERTKKRLSCTLQVEGLRHSGVVLDVSATGLFVQTGASPKPGARVQVECFVTGQVEPLALAATVARRQVVPAHLRGVVKGGMGLHIQHAPEEYYRYVCEIMGFELTEAKDPTAPAATSGAEQTSGEGESPEEAGADSRVRLREKTRRLALVRMRELSRPPPPGSTFRVRVRCGPRSRTLSVSAGSEQEARAQALQEAGEGDWEICACERKRD
jgi:hypothetical protein